MKKILKEILIDVPLLKTIGSIDVPVTSISFNSRTISEGQVFVAIKGLNADGHDYIQEAVKNKATAIICEVLPEQRHSETTYIQVENSAIALANISSAFYDYPSRKLKLIGVTGTNGKTTIATLLYNLFRKLGYKTGLISTVVYKIEDSIVPSSHTTPDSLTLNKLMYEMVEKGCEYCFMEVSSHAVVQHRIEGLRFTGAIFTNLTHDHLDYHKTFQNYLKAKKTFFDKLPAEAFALVNNDDKNGSVMIQNTKARKYTYALENSADFKCRIIENHIEGMHLKIDGTDVWCKLSGEFNAYNLVAIYATAVLLEEEKLQVLSTLSELEPAEGRFNVIRDAKNVAAVIDYAHTPDALEKVLLTIQKLRKGKIITVVGAGGDRDKQKRPEMGRIAVKYSDLTIFTSDNPRSEEPDKIIQDMIAGIDYTLKNKTLTIVDRKEAIKTAYVMAQSGDIILVAGKGHEKYQEIKGVKYPFDDQKIVKELMQL